LKCLCFNIWLSRHGEKSHIHRYMYFRLQQNQQKGCTWNARTFTKYNMARTPLFLYDLYGREYCTFIGISGALTFSPPAFGPSDNSTRTFRSMDTGSQKGFVLVTNVPKSRPTVRQPQNHSLGPRKSWTNCSSISLGPTVIMASPTLWYIVLIKSRTILIFLPKPLHCSHTLLKINKCYWLYLRKHTK
jgi:hypothetical protein